MKKFLVALLFVVSNLSLAQIVTVPIPGAPGFNITVGTGANALPLRDIRTNPNAVNITTSDDWYNEVPLGFTFPMFGQNFTTSWAATNGYVTFQNPQTSGLWGGCCSGVDLRNTTDRRYNYTIYGLHTDLYSWNGQNQYYLREGNTMTYGWYNLSQCCSSQGGNSFEIKIDSSGLIDTRIAGARVSWNAVTSGVAGDLSKGEYYQYYHGQGLNITPGSSSIFSWQALGGTGQGVDQCTINPLYSPSCPGYAAAYTAQQCTISALYNESCPGYQQAYFTQQCTANPLYNIDCPGYQQAYFNQQCSLSSLYSPQCPGYEIAYQTFLRNQACQANPQSSPTCPGYVTPMASSSTTTNNTTTEVAVVTSTSGTVSTTPAVVADPVVNRVVTTTSTSTAPTAPAAPVQLTSSSSSQQATTALVVESVQSSSTSSSSSSSSSSSGSSGSTGSTGSTASTTSTSSSGSSTTTSSPRQSLQQARMEAAKREAATKGNEAVKEAGEAKSMSAQIATQGLVIAAMGYNPSFDVYHSVVMKDVSFYKPFTIYGGQKNVDNARIGRRLFGATDQLHNEMVNSQYQLGN